MFYQEFNTYINLYKEEQLLTKYHNLYKEIKHQKNKNTFQKQFIKDYLNLHDLITKTNTTYINNLSNIKELNNINGYPLDNYQKNVVLSDEQNSLIIAGAGAGKSTTIIGKIIYLIKYKNIKPEDILCISFTNDSTISLKNNISKNINISIDIYTFHKLSLTILNKNNHYDISPDNLLIDIIEDFFNNTIPNNKIFLKSLKKVLGNKYSNKQITNLKKLILTFINLFKTQNYNITYFKTILNKNKYNLNIKEHIKNKYLLLLILNIYLKYQNTLKEENSIDFNDMINLSIESIKKYGLPKKWQYIIIDEFQDTSLIKLQLIQEIIKVTNAKLLVVGDDFQSIYRFTGCNLKIFINFKKYFPYTKEFYIINTYRNPQELINVAGNFIMKNTQQINKQLISHKHLNYPIKILYDNNIKGLKKLLTYISKYNYKDILVLGRNNKDILNYIDKSYTQNEDKFTYNNITFRYLTMHKSKGLESDIVIIINMLDKLNGMPTKIESDKILKYVNNSKEYFPYEEERRLFYVALTRTKNYCFILTNKQKESIFIKEIKKYKKYVEIIDI